MLNLFVGILLFIVLVQCNKINLLFGTNISLKIRSRIVKYVNDLPAINQRVVLSIGNNQITNNLITRQELSQLKNEGFIIKSKVIK